MNKRLEILNAKNKMKKIERHFDDRRNLLNGMSLKNRRDVSFLDMTCGELDEM